MYQGFWRNVKRSTNYLFRRRSRRGARQFRSTDTGIPHVRGKRHRKPQSEASHLLRLAGPALGASLLGILSLGPGKTGGQHTFTDGSLMFCMITVVFLVRSLTATAPERIRLIAAAASLPYPICLLFQIA